MTMGVTMGVTGTPCRYVERVSEGLRQRLRQAELLLAKGAAMGQKRREALAEQGTLEPQLDRLLEKTKELQKLVRGGLDPPRVPLGPPTPPDPQLCCADRGGHLQALRWPAGEPDGGLSVSPPRSGTHRGVLPPISPPHLQPWGAGSGAVASLGGAWC